MVLEDSQALDIVKKNPNGKFIQFLQGKYKVMRSHLTGIGARELIERVDGFERQNIVNARKKLMLSNKDMLSRTLKPRQKIYTAKGGIESYNLSTSEQIQEYKEFLSRCAGKRTSLKQYISNEIQKAYDIDPMGLKWVGVNDEGEPYPTYKCIMNIYDMVIEDGTPEYVIFKCTDAEIATYKQMGIIPPAAMDITDLKCFRCVCDGWERIIIWVTDPVILAFMPNPFGVVQGEVVSDIVTEDENGFKYYESDLYEVSELLTQFVFSRSIYNIAYSQTAYPLMWMQRQDCPTCGGKKKVSSPLDNSGGGRPQQNDLTCPECKGTGTYPHFQNSDTFIWEFNKDTTGKVPVPPLGIIETAIENLQYMKQEKIDIETLVNETIWGVAKVDPNSRSETKTIGTGNTSETAFEANLNEEPKKDKLKTYSRWLSNTIKWYADTMGRFKYEQDYISSAILCGDRYGIESPDEILTRITKAKEGGASQSILESLQMEYFETKYENNPLELRRAKIYYLGEPFFFFGVEDILTWPQIPQIQLLEKQYWGEFMCTLNDQIIASIPDDNIIPVVNKMLRDFVIGKYQADKQADALLFANDGSMLNIGDNARVKANMAKDEKHMNKKGRVTGIADDSVVITFDEDISATYSRNALERII